MPEHFRALLVISALIGVAYLISKRLFAFALEPKFIEKLFAGGFTATLAMFTSNSIWLFFAFLAAFSYFISRRSRHPLSFFVFFLLFLPGSSAQVPGFGLIGYLIDLNPWRVLTFSVLLPAAVRLAGDKYSLGLGKLFADKLAIAYVLLLTVLAYLHYLTFTGALRELVTNILDFTLLFFVASRTLVARGAVRHVIAALVMSALFLALVGGFEFLKKWMLYSAVKAQLSASTVLLDYVSRGSTLRASATTGQPIALGFVMMTAIMLSLYAQHLVRKRSDRVLLWCVLGFGLMSAMSRGPWVGACAGFVAVALVGRKPISNISKLTAVGFVMALTLILIPGGGAIINYLPWVGAIDAGGISFRELLWEKSLLVIAQNPWIGSADYTSQKEFDVIRNGGGFVDIVNSYVGVALSHGLIGLSLFLLLIAASIHSVLKTVLKLRFHFNEVTSYGIAIFGALVACLVTIATVSRIGQIDLLLTFLMAASIAARTFATNEYRRVALRKFIQS